MRRIMFVLALTLAACAAPAVPNTATSAPATATALPVAVNTAATALPTNPQPIASGIDADGYHTLGDPAAPVTLTDYSDYF